ncbi:ABC transporter ATP-binding protein [Shinella sp. HZN7]|uniref:ABC transporter ATP-binding protein n=1 Tax=Shinella sp. (strain HZN7) TaxID=879274 RepID=UPI0007DA5EB5|nr:ATP-binding cassette domain-containing protein [Shinella sp. HZN7]ANH03402.1 iron-hydroxamate transporter ATP-binding subunit [Shinella sp. HZN7]
MLHPSSLLSDARPLFSLDGISYSVDGRTILHALDLQLFTGKTIGLIGHNGSGKSTLIKILARQITPTAGYIRFGERPLDGWPNREFARNLAYMPQQTPVAAGTRVRELVKFGRYPWHGALGAFRPKDARKVDEALDLTGMTALADRPVETLSGGEHQRAWLAVLVAQDTRCFLLDEPISALDIAHQIAVLDLIRTLTKTKGLSVIMVLHDVNMASRYCDEIIALHGGSLIARGSPQSIMTPDVLKAVYGVDFRVYGETGDGPLSALVR